MVDKIILTENELDAIGEILNISMGSAATAVSTMLEKKVMITTPQLEQNSFKNIDCSNLEPALIVKIKYIKGIEGTNITMFRRNDMRIILDLLMGNDISDSEDDFEFDDMSMSAACEVMNQMMGASATALSEVLNMPINISTPDALLIDKKEELQHSFFEFQEDEMVVAISFHMIIKDILDTTFTCFLSLDLAKKIVDQVCGEVEENHEPISAPIEQPSSFSTMPDITMTVHHEPEAQSASIPNNQPKPVSKPIPQPAQPAQTQPVQPPLVSQQPVATAYAQQQNTMPYEAVSIKHPEFPNFSQQTMQASVPSSLNMGLLMGVQLDISVVVGRTKQKIKDIMEFGQGTVIELDKQTGAPAEILVNGQLFAYGDVIVVDDNFGVRITEIVATKEMMDSLGGTL